MSSCQCLTFELILEFYVNLELPSEEAREILPGKRPERSGDEDKYHGTSLKLNNNMLKDISALPASLGDLMYNPMELTWIDLSCNELPVISEVFVTFRCPMSFLIISQMAHVFP